LGHRPPLAAVGLRCRVRGVPKGHHDSGRPVSNSKISASTRPGAGFSRRLAIM
jgi:hypothetical protein